jgi:hypothetical protein
MRRLAALAIAAAAVSAMSGCSPGVDYPSIFPAVHDMPPPRADTTMDADQVQQATEALITQRNHLTAETQGNGQDKTANPPAPDSAKRTSTAAPATPGSITVQGAAAGGAQTAGAETKP